MGSVMEKQQSYRDAADHYENAWSMMNYSVLNVGFKLAANHLKSKRYIEAIDVCHRVLAKDPRFPHIRREILDKARAALMP